MVKNIFIIGNIHSFVDVITNSSTELFVCETDKSIHTVKELLIKIIENYNELVVLMDKPRITFDETFDEPFEYTNKMFDEKDSEYSYDYETKDNIGKILIRSAYDNSIPFTLWETLNEIFEADNVHLG